jgi:hypothetical protein
MNVQRRLPDDRAGVDPDEPVYRLDIMTQADVPDVSRVERRCFANPWPASAYRRELLNPAQNHYVVLRRSRVSSSLDADGSRADAVFADGDVPTKAVPRRSLLPIGLGRRPERNGHEQTVAMGSASCCCSAWSTRRSPAARNG